jgi:hypothetical protein
MRRLNCLVVVVLALLACPTSADAYFWTWLDDLSGPRFHDGKLVEWKVWCKTERADKVLQSFSNDLDADVLRYRQGEQDALGNRAFRPPVEAIENAKAYVTDAVTAQATGLHDPRPFLAEALRWRRIAQKRFEAAEQFASAPFDRAAVSWRTLSTLDDKRDVARVLTAFMSSAVPGIAVSLCDTKPLDKQTRYVNVNISWGYDKKATETNDNRLVLLGASYHAVFTPWLAAGVGGGVATFSSRTQPSFQKIYIEPFLVDIRPLQAAGDGLMFLYRCAKPGEGLKRCQKSDKQKVAPPNPLLQVLYVRFGSLIFPTGFEPDRFNETSPRFPAEFIRTRGFHFDFEPLIRKLRNRY